MTTVALIDLNTHERRKAEICETISKRVNMLHEKWEGETGDHGSFFLCILVLLFLVNKQQKRL